MRRIFTISLLNVGTHLLMWGVLLGFPYLLSRQFNGDNGVPIDHILRPLVEYLVVFYLNYFFLIDHFLFRKKKFLLFVLLNLLLILVFRFDGWLFRSFSPDAGIPYPDRIRQSRSHGFDGGMKSIFLLTVPTVFAVAIRSVRNWSRLEAERKDILNRHLQTELQLLKYQLQPHFFFNSLNNIYSLVDISPSRAQEAIHSLSRLMRYLLHDGGREKIRLSEEIGFLKKYIQLMELRQTDKTTVRCQFPDALPEHLEIAPLLFMPLIENAYKHGVSTNHPSVISFNLSIHENLLIFTGTNNNYPNRQGEMGRSGIGLDNLRKRLDLVYPGRHVFEASVDNTIYRVELKIEL